MYSSQLNFEIHKSKENKGSRLFQSLGETLPFRLEFSECKTYTVSLQQANWKIEAINSIFI